MADYLHFADICKAAAALDNAEDYEEVYRQFNYIVKEAANLATEKFEDILASKVRKVDSDMHELKIKSMGGI